MYKVDQLQTHGLKPEQQDGKQNLAEWCQRNPPMLHIHGYHNKRLDIFRLTDTRKTRKVQSSAQGLSRKPWHPKTEVLERAKNP